MTSKFCTVLTTVLTIIAVSGPAIAQPFGPGGAFMGPGMMAGPGMMGSGMMGRRLFGMCNPAATGSVEWWTDRLVDDVSLTDAQRAKFDEFKAASIKAGEMMSDACLADIPGTIVARAEAMEKRMDAMLQAIRSTRPALEAFYATLTDDQKAKLDSFQGRRFWHWRYSW
ncbi:Spy/CpxP family protein refolding chaperone [Bradyrhizobium erythrophlei]|uniref:Spy/CpxP family protein refolding chaperone n=1 Tax=Bradyrhizobium erythrophlei TaxID=1437360 RepID=UPI0035F009CB